MALETSYTSTPHGAGAFAPRDSQQPEQTYWPLEKLRRAYTDYLFSKREEIDEQIEARRYYHGSHWTREQVDILKKRKQPIMTFNRISRKINAVIGLVERLRQDPKAYPRTPQHEEGAELATATIRYVMDEEQWKEKSSQSALAVAVDGIGGIELELEEGDHGDPEVGFDLTDTQAFFYDPRSFQYDFSDARYMGVGKWLDKDIAEEMFPDADFSKLAADSELTTSSDREMRWFSTEGAVPRVRVVDIWYKHQGGWCWAIFCGNDVLMEGKSYFQDEKGEDFCKYIMFSGNVDQDGDRYGFVRNMKSAQDGINAKQSKMQHMVASRRLMISQGAVADIEQTRKEWAREDGVIVTNRSVQDGIKADDRSVDFAGWAKLLELNMNEIENFGPNPALIGQGVENKSGRAIALLQQAGIAELGPYILALRGWKLRVYRAVWNAIQQHWKAERWIRVTDDEDLAQFIQLNGLQVDPQTGMPTLVNAIGSLDVDLIIDEGPDVVNMMADAYDTLTVLASQGAQIPPQVMIELSPLAQSVKKKISDMMEKAASQPNPGQQLQMMLGQAKTHQTEADANLKEAQTAKTLVEAHMSPLQGLMMGEQQPSELDQVKTAADIEATQAKTEHVRAQALKTTQDAMLAPQQMALDFQTQAQRDRARNAPAT